MRKWFVPLLFCACGSTLAFAQSGEISVSGGVTQIGGALITDTSTPGNPDVTWKDGFRLAIRFTWNQGKLLSHEVGYGYSRTQLWEQGQEIAPISAHQGFYDALINATPEGSRVRPFACAGVQFTSFYPPGASVYGGSVTKFGFNYGAGIKVKLTPMWGIRADFRQYAMGKPDFGFGPLSGWMRLTEITGGFAFLF
jgi:opacity protein-like surface antigen